MNDRMMKKNKVYVFITFMVIMIGLGASDSLRGIFAGVFETHFGLSKPQLSIIVTVSYIGNLAFMLFGSRLFDKFDKKKVCLAVMLLWMSGLILYFLTDNFYCLLIGMFITMGSSTLMNTFINILSPVFFGTGAAMAINALFFTQGIGTSTSQNVIGRFADTFHDFQCVNIGLLVIGVIGTAFLLFLSFSNKSEKKEESNESKLSLIQLIKTPAFIYFTAIFGFYFIAEHGVLNWWVLYCKQALNCTGEKAAMYLSLFYGGMTIGRLIFVPAVHKLTAKAVVTIFGGIGAVLYIVGILFGKPTLLLVSLAGLFISLLYPMMVLIIQDYFPNNVIATVTGTIISFGTILEIAFNAAFGKIIEQIGFRKSILIFPISMFLFYSLYIIFIKTQKGKEK